MDKKALKEVDSNPRCRAHAVCVSVKNSVFCKVPSSRNNVVSCFTY